MKCYEVREVRSSLLISDLQEAKFSDSGKVRRRQGARLLHVLWMRDNLWGRVLRLSSATSNLFGNVCSAWLAYSVITFQGTITCCSLAKRGVFELDHRLRYVFQP